MDPAGIVDAHAHLWSSAVAGAAWLRSREHDALRREFTAGDFGRVVAGLPVRDAIAVVAGETHDETRWLLAEAGRSSLFGGVVGWVDSEQDAARQLDELASTEGGGGLVGIRIPAAGDSGVLVGTPMSRLLAELGRRRMTFDLLVRAEGLEDAIACVRAHPDTLFVLDHLGNPPAESESRPTWARALGELAGSENVRAKISGLTRVHRSAASVREVIDIALAVFGPSRLMLGSDWPVSTLATEYGSTIDRYLEAIRELSRGEQDLIMHGTATKTYDGTRDRAR
jgi:L-fuconolactonase